MNTAQERLEFRRFTDWYLEEATQVAIVAMTKYPQPNYVCAKLGEKAGEVIRSYIHMTEGRDVTKEQLRDEVVQLIALVLRLIWEGDETIVAAAPMGGQPL